MWDLIVSVPDHCLSFYFDRSGFYSSLTKRLHKVVAEGIQQSFIILSDML